MDQATLNIIVGTILAALGWFARMLWDRMREQEQRLNELEVRLAGEYVSNVDLAQAISDMKAVVQTLIGPVQENLQYIRARVDGLPQRRAGDPP
jgi:uncharacterized coiled-coil protein SlyX